MVGGGGGAAGLVKKLGTVALTAVVEGSGFVVGAGEVMVAGLVKKLGPTGCTGTGTVFEDRGVGICMAKRFFAGSLVSVVVASVADFDCVGAAGAGIDKLGTIVWVVVVVAGVGAGAGEGFFSGCAAFFVS